VSFDAKVVVKIAALEHDTAINSTGAKREVNLLTRMQANTGCSDTVSESVLFSADLHICVPLQVTVGDKLI
jgi:hypothetical protein